MRLACELRQEGWEIAGIDLSGDPAVGEWYENGCFNCLSLRSVWTINCPSRSLWFVSNSILSTAFYVHVQGDFCPCFKVCARAGISFSSSLWRGLVTLTFNFSFEKRQVGLCCLRFVVIVLLLSLFYSCSYQFTFCQLLFLVLALFISQFSLPCYQSTSSNLWLDGILEIDLVKG